MKSMALSVRTTKEILRDPLHLGFGLGFPLILLLLMTAIQANIPVSVFEIANLAPGIAVFGLSFMALFSASLLARDRESALLQRLYTSPLSAADFIAGYAFPMLPIALMQCIICYIAAIALGLPISPRLALAVLLMLPAMLLCIARGLLCGSVLGIKQLGGICGALLTNLTAWFSGAWFDPNLVGGVFKKLANALPFLHAVELQRAVLRGDYAAILPHMYWVIGYAAVAAIAAVLLFLRQMKRQ